MAYINARVDQVGGKTVKAALQETVLNTKGEAVQYTRSDVRYDVGRGLLVLTASPGSE
jgi:hypothetical protein